MTVAIVCQYQDGYFIMEAAAACGVAGLSHTPSARLAGQMWHLAGRCPAGPSFELEEEIMTWLDLLTGEVDCVPNVPHDL